MDDDDEEEDDEVDVDDVVIKFDWEPVAGAVAVGTAAETAKFAAVFCNSMATFLIVDDMDMDDMLDVEFLCLRC